MSESNQSRGRGAVERLGRPVVGLPVGLLAGAMAVTLAAGSGTGIGTVVNDKAEPLLDVSACYVLNGVEVMCSSTDKQGVFELVPSEIGKIRLTLPGYLPQLFDELPDEPIVLARAAEIWVRLVGPNGSPLEAGEVYLIFPDGQRKGPFPANAKGVRVRTLAPGGYRVVAQAEGFVQPRLHGVELVAGVVADAVVEMVRDPGPETD